MKMNPSTKIQCLIIGIVAATSIVVVTILSLTFLQQVIDVFYTATINAIVITVIIVVGARWVHNKLVTV